MINLELVDALAAAADAKGRTVARLAIAWILARGDDIVPLVGAQLATLDSESGRA